MGEGLQILRSRLTDMQNFVFSAPPADSKDNAFYEELVKVPDYMGDNTTNNFVFKLLLVEGNMICKRITFTKK